MTKLTRQWLVAQVKFPDGTIKYGIYNGTVDVYWEPLFDTHDEAWDAWREYYNQDIMKIYAELKEVKAWRHFCPKCDKQLNTIFPPVVCDCCGKWKFDINKNNYVMEIKDEA